MLNMKCPHCGQDLNIPEKYAGQIGKCKKCNGDIAVPALVTLKNLGPESPDLTDIESQLNRPSVFDDATNATPSSAKPQKTVTCVYCRLPMDIDASICPNCRKPGGISHTYMLAGGIFGALGGFVAEYISVFGGADADVDPGAAVFCSLCVCNPLFWVFVIPGMLLGVIAGGVAAYFKKKEIKEQP